ncbi:3-dehydroquinate dehydratase [Streptomyces sp. TLI_235]|nr:type II 3-dehydroquinate dehydratase [Streptomyces sp. TLI_235]PBC78709.1 3-dehydroquinate dehydratase [Streptomyces sp. TLI_235]
MTLVYVLNGPNLARLGLTEPGPDGRAAYPELVRVCQETAAELDLRAVVLQTDSEAELVGWLHRVAEEAAPLVLNPAAFTHCSYPVRDALALRRAPAIEVHLCNPYAREPFRRVSVLSDVVDGTVTGLGTDSYRLALHAVARLTGAGARPEPQGAIA